MCYKEIICKNERNINRQDKEMLRVGICDDEELIIDALDSIIQEIVSKNGWKIAISHYQSGRELLKDVFDLDAVFLDIDMPELDGIETGRKVCEMNSECKIIMATGRTDRFKEAFHIKAFRFVTKPFDCDEIEEALQTVMKGQIGLETIELFENRVPYLICQRDIFYISAYDGYSEFIVSGRNKTRLLRKECSLSEVEQELSGELFFRVSRQYIVNLGKIAKYEKGSILIQDKRILVSRRKKKEFEQAYLEYDLKYRG